jgi:hypothetical protein
VAFGLAANVVHLAGVVLGQHSHKVIREEDGVVVAHDEPVHFREVEPVHLRHNARQANRGPAADLVRVPELRSVGGDLAERHVHAPARLVPHGLLQPDVAAHLARLPPLLHVTLAAFPQFSGRGDAEHYVRQARILRLPVHIASYERRRSSTINPALSIHTGCVNYRTRPEMEMLMTVANGRILAAAAEAAFT